MSGVNALCLARTSSAWSSASPCSRWVLVRQLSARRLTESYRLSIILAVIGAVQFVDFLKGHPGNPGRHRRGRGRQPGAGGACSAWPARSPSGSGGRAAS